MRIASTILLATVAFGALGALDACVVRSQPGYVQTGYVQTRPAYVQTQPVYVQTRPVYVQPQPVYVQQQPTTVYVR